MKVRETMDKIGYGKWGGWTAPLTLLLCFVAATTAQPGFLSIDCGSSTNYSDVNNIRWVTDDNYIDHLGQRANIGNETETSYGLRFFPKPLNKSCYHLPVEPQVAYLVRLTFSTSWSIVRNYSGLQTEMSFAFSIETNGTLYMRNLSVPNVGKFYAERILASSGTVLYVCLVRTLESDDPFISAIELRKLQDGMYGQVKPGTILKHLWRTYFGEIDSTIRYPYDKFDRIWRPRIPSNNLKLSMLKVVSSNEATSINNTKDLPPPAVMQTAWILNSSEPAQFSLGPFDDGGKRSLLILYFAEVQTLDISESRSFYITINGGKRLDTITLPRNYSALELTIPSNQTDDFQFALVEATYSTLPPIINAFEYYTVFDTRPATNLQDIEAIVAIKEMFNMSAWISDPCFLIEWDGIHCDNSTSVIRISEINLSTMNLNGLVPEQIGQLTALVKMSLDNNNLMGPLPDFSNLTKLERLHLQNNNLNGSLPDWLSALKNLKELFVENNNFSGEIPQQLLHNPSLTLKYYGNPYLSTLDSVEHKPPNPRHTKLREQLALGITLSGVPIIVLSLIAGIVLYRKKKECVTTESNGVENVVHFTPKEWLDATNMEPNSAKACAFTLDQMMTATQKFRAKIGKGGFGPVFFGKLPEGKDIAVKVLSLFSKQGVHEFLNEIDVLSRVHHKNLVTLLGYCNESKELMIIYEHMSGGSLRDRLYGPNAGSELNWKTRVKIALDAAQGLEYMHVACTPKIIHRDVKTANILLDSNLKGKLGDFGLSKIWIDEEDGEASHVTTMVKGTAGYLDPEYFSTQRLTEKSDVYSFGVVLLEIICGRQPIDAKLSLDKLNIIHWATPFVEMDTIPGKIEEIIDKKLSENYNIMSITRVANVAIRCVKAESFCRPSISEVVAELREAIKLEEM